MTKVPSNYFCFFLPIPRVFFGAFLYLTERDNPDEEMASNYNTVPNAMVSHCKCRSVGLVSFF